MKYEVVADGPDSSGVVYRDPDNYGLGNEVYDPVPKVRLTLVSSGAGNAAVNGVNPEHDWPGNRKESDLRYQQGRRDRDSEQSNG